MARPGAPVRTPLALVVVAVLATAVGAQPAAPTIHAATLDGVSRGATTSDRHTLTINYTHPAMQGVPPPFYRVRTWPDVRGPVNWGPYQANTASAWQFPVPLVRSGMTDPIPGRHTVEVQIRDSLGQESNVAQVVVTRVVAPVVVPPSQTVATYRVSGATIAALLGHATLRGYLNTAEPMNPNSRCLTQQNASQGWELYVAHLLGGGVPSPHCRFRFFTARLLQNGWHLRSATIAPTPIPATFVMEHPVKPSGTDASFSVLATAPGVSLPRGWLNLAELVFEGPPDGEWRHAFRP